MLMLQGGDAIEVGSCHREGARGSGEMEALMSLCLLVLVFVLCRLSQPMITGNINIALLTNSR